MARAPRPWNQLPDEHPPTLDYRGPQKEKPRPKGIVLPDSQSAGRFLFGFFGSIILSAVLWFPFGDYLFRQNSDHALNLAYILGGGKLVLAFALISFGREYRALGIGILASLPVSGMIAYGACAVNVLGGMSRM